jgi:hypothetical protein
MIDVAGEAEERPADHQAEAHGPHLAQGHQTQVPRQPITAPRDRQSPTVETLCSIRVQINCGNAEKVLKP